MPYVSNMTTPSSTGVSGTGSPSSPSPTTGAGDNEIDQDMFLKLLVAQLKYQDPLNPADSSEFLAQTAQFTTVEKLNQLARDSASMVVGQRMTAASSLIGRAVTYAGDAGADATATVLTARITDAGDIMLKLSDGEEVALAGVKAIAQAGPAAS